MTEAHTSRWDQGEASETHLGRKMSGEGGGARKHSHPDKYFGVIFLKNQMNAKTYNE